MPRGKNVLWTARSSSTAGRFFMCIGYNLPRYHSRFEFTTQGLINRYFRLMKCRGGLCNNAIILVFEALGLPRG